MTYTNDIKAGDTVKLTGSSWPVRSSSTYTRGSEHVVTRVEGDRIHFGPTIVFNLTDNWNMEVVRQRPKVGDKVLISEDAWTRKGEVGTLKRDDGSGIPFAVVFPGNDYEIWFQKGAVTKVEEENKMNEFQPGDHIKATRKDNPKVTITDVVKVSSVVGERGSINGESFYLTSREYTFELLERPYNLPTEQGIYVVDTEEGLTTERLSGRRTYALSHAGYWSASDNLPDTHAAIVRRFTEKKAKLVRLTLEK